MVVVKQSLVNNYEVALPRRRRRAKTRVKVPVISMTTVFVCVLVFIALMLSIQTTQVYLMRSQIFNLEAELNTTQESFNAASLAVAQLKSPDRIVPLAQDNCRLMLPREEQYVAINVK